MRAAFPMVCLTALLGVSACSGTPTLTDDLAEKEVYGLLNYKVVWTNGPNERCNRYFDLGSVTVTDKIVEERKAKVTARVVVTAKQDIPEFYHVNRCFGSVEGGWKQGRVATSIQTVSFELWDSGWKAAPFDGPQ